MYYYKEHTADFILGVEAKDLKELYEDAAKGLFFSFLDIKFNEKNLKEEHTIIVEGEDEADLLVSFLNELIYLFEVKKIILWKVCEIKIKNNKGIIKMKGEKYNPSIHAFKSSSPKAATYHNLLYEKNEKGIKAEIVIDI